MAAAIKNRLASEELKHFTVATAGHVDHGKTALLRALTGIDPDRLKEEKERGMTTDLGFAYLPVDGRVVIGFVDVPGHGKFLKNMLAGVGGIDLALLVVACDEGPMPQTIQHVRILSLLGITNVVVALTKIDLLADQERRQGVLNSTKQLIGAHGMNMLELVPVSTVSGQGLPDLKSALVKALVELPERVLDGTAFLPVDRVFSKDGFGTVITGTLVQGQLRVGDQIVVGPRGVSARVRRLETFGRNVDCAKQGQRLACNIVLKGNAVLARGDVILGSEQPATTSILVRLVDQPQQLAGELSKFLERQPIRLYHGTAECHGRVRWSEQVAVGTAMALIALEQPVLVRPGDRFILRVGDQSVLGGEVIIRERPRWLKRAELLYLGRLILSADFKSALLSFLQSAPGQMATPEQIALFMPACRYDSLVEQLVQGGEICTLGVKLLLASGRRDLSRQLQEAIAAFTQADLLNEKDGITLEQARSRLSCRPKMDRATFQVLVEVDSASGLVVRDGDRLRLPGNTSARTSDVVSDELQARILPALDTNFCLELTEVAEFCAADLKQVKAAVLSLAKSGRIYLISYEFVISRANLQTAGRALVDLWNINKNIAPGDFRQALGTSRKYAMALLQHFDDSKVTRRLAAGRVLLKMPIL